MVALGGQTYGRGRNIGSMHHGKAETRARFRSRGRSQGPPCPPVLSLGETQLGEPPVSILVTGQKGLIDRFRSLPMSRSAVVAGTTITELLRGALAVAIMFVVGLAVGFCPEGNVLDWAAGLGLLLFAFAFAWIGVTIGMLVGTTEQGIRTTDSAEGQARCGYVPHLASVDSAFLRPNYSSTVLAITNGWQTEPPNALVKQLVPE